MKRTALALLIALCLVPLTLESYKISVKASPTTWVVDDDGPANFTSIQEAINAANPGDTIFVHNGTYYENLIINKSITLVGENRDYTIINGSKIDSVVLIKASNVTVKCFTITMGWGVYYGSGIQVESVSGTVICDNNINDSLRGISLYYSVNTNVSNNFINSSYFDGIYLRSSSSSIIYNNTISSNKYGITFDSSDGNIVSGNTVYRNEFNGIILFYSRNNVFCGNIIDKNNNGITLILSSSGNIVYHNNFYNNEQQVYTDSRNVWDYDGEGNYWSDYSGYDLVKDGIGDTPYVIDDNNRDNFPLMGSFYNFNVNYAEKNYQIAVVSDGTVSNFNFEVVGEVVNKIIRFNVSSVEGFFGFCRLTIPAELMGYPYIVLVNGASVSPAYLNISGSYVRMYFACPIENAQVLIISSETLRLYFE
ncbi:MAG: right-handed parallel beta-helix repeat-containing protein, partial [Candidatus Bathyarchaeales archaeon]